MLYVEKDEMIELFEMVIRFPFIKHFKISKEADFLFCVVEPGEITVGDLFGFNYEISATESLLEDIVQWLEEQEIEYDVEVIHDVATENDGDLVMSNQYDFDCRLPMFGYNNGEGFRIHVVEILD